MSDARTRQAYLSILSRAAEQNLALTQVPAALRLDP
jgi:hypothetical protein